MIHQLTRCLHNIVQFSVLILTFHGTQKSDAKAMKVLGVHARAGALRLLDNSVENAQGKLLKFLQGHSEDNNVDLLCDYSQQWGVIVSKVVESVDEHCTPVGHTDSGNVAKLEEVQHA
jgi:hypothetical protein